MAQPKPPLFDSPRSCTSFNLHTQGLCHVSEISERFLSDLTVDMPDAFRVGDIIRGKGIVIIKSEESVQY